jgi:hypothetical protein
MRIILAGIAVLGLVVTGCNEKKKGDANVTDDGIAAANAWLAVVDGGRYAESWDGACTYFRGVVPKDQWVQQVSGVRGPLGTVSSREVLSAKHTTKLPGAPDGDYVVIQYRTSFQNKSNAIETVTPMRDDDGVYRVSGYYVR